MDLTERFSILLHFTKMNIIYWKITHSELSNDIRRVSAGCFFRRITRVGSVRATIHSAHPNFLAVLTFCSQLRHVSMINCHFRPSQVLRLIQNGGNRFVSSQVHGRPIQLTFSLRFISTTALTEKHMVASPRSLHQMYFVVSAAESKRESLSETCLTCCDRCSRDRPQAKHRLLTFTGAPHVVLLW